MTIEKRTTFTVTDLASVRVTCAFCKNEVVLKLPWKNGEIPKQCPCCPKDWTSNAAAWGALSKFVQDMVLTFRDNRDFGVTFETVRPIDDEGATKGSQE